MRALSQRAKEPIASRLTISIPRKLGWGRGARMNDNTRNEQSEEMQNQGTSRTITIGDILRDLKLGKRLKAVVVVVGAGAAVATASAPVAPAAVPASASAAGKVSPKPCYEMPDWPK